VDYKPDLSQIVYAKLDGTLPDSAWDHLYVRPIAGGAETAITSGPAGPGTGFYGDWQPCFSPDGQWVAFASSRGDLVYGSTSVWVVKTDGTGLKKIGGTIEATWPTLEPGGNAVVYTDAAMLYRVARTGSNTWGTPAMLADHVNHARFSHDGKFLAFDYQSDIWVMNYATLTRANVTNDGPSPEDASPTWGATDDVLAFSSRGRAGNANTAIYIASGLQSLLATPVQQVTLGRLKAKYR
jgi:Tol biopolymer transport system component